MTPDTELLLGGSWHDFPSFAEVIERTLGPVALSCDVRTSRRLGSLEPHVGTPQVLVLYTCLDETAGFDHEPSELEALTAWVRRGGGLLALHSTAVAARRHARLAALLGGTFVSHPSKRRFEVIPMLDRHPITEGIQAFCIEDELYALDYDPAVHVHLVTFYEGRAHPLAWSRREGAGKVVYLALGHDASAWNHPSFVRLLTQARQWLRPIPGS